MPDAIDTTALARRFASILSATLGPQRLAEVVRRNATPAYGDACASHDFIDANDCLLEAMAQMSIALETSDDAQVAALSEAWDLARAANFRAEDIHGQAHDASSAGGPDPSGRQRDGGPRG